METNKILTEGETAFRDITLTNETINKLLTDGLREESRYFMICVDRDNKAADSDEDLQHRFGKEIVSTLKNYNSTLQEYFYFCDIREYCFREGSDGKVQVASLPKLIVLQSYLPAYQFFKGVLQTIFNHTIKFRTTLLQSLIRNRSVSTFNKVRLPIEDKRTDLIEEAGADPAAALLADLYSYSLTQNFPKTVKLPKSNSELDLKVIHNNY